jgi:hypothetical protein
LKGLIVNIKSILRSWLPAVPAAVQDPIGLRVDDDFRAPEPGIIERFAGYWRGVPIYRERAPRPVWIRDERAVANEKAAAERRGNAPLWFVDDGAQPDRIPYSDAW